MLRPGSDRLSYSHLLAPPPDYYTDFALGTTYSLDLEAMLGIPMALFMSEELGSSATQNPVAVLEGLRRSTDNLAIFCEPGQIKIPHKNNTVYSLVESSVFQVHLPRGRSFHPKVWVIRYAGPQKDPIYRIIVLSRNLTFDRSWDMAVCLDGKKGDEPTEKNSPVQDFIGFLIQHINSRKKRRRIKNIQEEIGQVYFDPQIQQVADFQFCPLGIDGHDKKSSSLFQSYKDLVIISPFLSKTPVKEFDSLALSNSSRTLITRRAELPKLLPEHFESFQVYVMKELVAEGEEGLSEDELQAEVPQNQDIHAKFYARSKGSNHALYFGSANCTQRAFDANVEFLLKLDYRKWGFKLADILDDIFGKDDKDNPFEKIESIPQGDFSDDDPADELQRAIKELCRGKMRAHVISGEHQNFNIQIELERIPDKVCFTVSSLAGEQQVKLEKTTVIQNIRLEHLSEFYKISASKNDLTVRRIIKIPTGNIPPERDKAVFKTIIKDRQAFLKYLSFLLSDSILLTSMEQFDADRLKTGKWKMQPVQNPVLYEHLLRTVAREPERLKEIEKVLRFIDDPEIVPEEFNALFDKCRKASKRVKR